MFKELVQDRGIPQQSGGVNIGGGVSNTYNTYINTGKKGSNTSTPQEHVCIASSNTYCEDYCPQCEARGYSYDYANDNSVLGETSFLFIGILKDLFEFLTTPTTPKYIALPQTIEEEVNEIIETVKPKKKDNILEEWANMQQEKEESTLDAWKAREEEKAKKTNFKSLLDNPENFKYRKAG